MKLYKKRNFAAAVIAMAVSAACLTAYFTAGRAPRFLIAFFLALVYAGMECGGALSKSSPPVHWDGAADERDLLIAMKTSQTTLLLLNRLLLSACLVSILFYAVSRRPSCMAVVITLCAISIALSVILLLTNLYYEKHC